MEKTMNTSQKQITRQDSGSTDASTRAKKQRPVHAIGITGTMGSGKSTVAHALADFIPVTDCDRINDALMGKGAAGYTALQKAGLLQVDAAGHLDRMAQAARMFSDPAYKAGVEAILFPLIEQSMEAWIAAQEGLCAVEVPLLFESGMESHFDVIWCVVCDLPVALERLQTGRHISKEQAMVRIEKQMPPEEKIARSTDVITNNGTLEEIGKQIDSLLEKLGKTA